MHRIQTTVLIGKRQSLPDGMPGLSAVGGRGSVIPGCCHVSAEGRRPPHSRLLGTIHNSK